MHAEVCVIIIVLTICTLTQSAGTYMLNTLSSNKIIEFTANSVPIGCFKTASRTTFPLWSNIFYFHAVFGKNAKVIAWHLYVYSWHAHHLQLPHPTGKSWIRHCPYKKVRHFRNYVLCFNVVPGQAWHYVECRMSQITFSNIKCVSLQIHPANSAYLEGQLSIFDLQSHFINER